MRNQLNDRDRISREELNSFKDGGESLSESKLEEGFIKDTIEGWEEMNYDLSSMEAMDQKFYPTQRNKFHYSKIVISLLGLSTIVLAVALLLQQTNSDISPLNESKNIQDEKRIHIEVSDLTVQPAIAKLKEAEPKYQIQPGLITKDFNVQKSLEEDVSSLPIRPIKELQQVTESPVLENRKYGKEIYLSDFKVLDYDIYRKDMPISAEEVLLTGTPANQSEKESMILVEKSVIEIKYNDYLNKSLYYFKDENYKQTLDRLNIILEQFPRDVNALFYKGICLFNFGKYDESIPLFKKCLNNEYTNFDQEAIWYLGRSYELSGQQSKAKEIYTLIANQGGYYSEQAKQQLK